MSMVYYHWGSRRPRLRVLEPRPVDWGRETLGNWQCDREREAAAGATALVPRQWSPPPDVAENNNNITQFEGYTYNKGMFYIGKLMCG